jgi:hypothetical protein
MQINAMCKKLSVSFAQKHLQIESVWWLTLYFRRRGALAGESMYISGPANV